MRSTIRHALLLGIGVVLGYAAMSSAVVICTPLGSLTTNLNLCKPAAGETNWTNAINNNWDVIDGVLSGLSGTNPPNGSLLIGNGTSFTTAVPTGASGIVITTGPGTLEISCSGCGGGGGSLTTNAVGYGVAGVLSGDPTKFYYDEDELKVTSGGTERFRLNQSGSSIVGAIGAETGANSGLTAAQVAWGTIQPGLYHSSTSAPQLVLEGAAGGGPLVTFIQHQGTLAAPTASGNNSILLYLEAVGYDTTDAPGQATRLMAEVDGTNVAAGVPGRWVFLNTDSAGATNETARISADQRVSAASSVQVGGITTLNVGLGQYGMTKTSGTNQAPGAGGAKFGILCGTNAGTAKIVAYAGTDTTAFTVLDNIGAGVTGC